MKDSAILALLGFCLLCGALSFRGCPAKADMGSDMNQLVRELAGVRRALESGKCGGK